MLQTLAHTVAASPFEPLDNALQTTADATAQVAGDPSAWEAFLGSVESLFAAVLGVFSSPDALTHPDNVVAHLQNVGWVWAAVFLVIGLLCMFKGAEHHRLAVIALAGGLGVFGGYWLGEVVEAKWIVAASLGLLLAVVALPLMKYTVAALGGLAGAFLGANVWAAAAFVLDRAGHAAIIPEGYWIGAMLGLIVCGMSAFVLYEFSLALVTALGGATIAALGALALLLSFDWSRTEVAASVTASQVVVPLLVFVPATVALVLQAHRLRGEEA